MKDLNLIPKSYLLAKKKKIKRIRAIITTIVSIILIVACVVVPLFLKYNLEKQLKDLGKDIEGTKGYQTALQKMTEVRVKYDEREQLANSLKSYGVSAVTVFEKIEKCVPEKLFITDLSIAGDSRDKAKISLTGICATEDDVASFVSHLREDSYFSDIIISSINKNTVELNPASVTAIISNTSASGKTTSTGKKKTNTKTVKKPKSTPLPESVTSFGFNISLFTKISN